MGYTISDQTVGNILKRNGLVPAPEREKTTLWKDFIRINTREIHVAGLTPHPNQPLMDQMDRNIRVVDLGFLMPGGLYHLMLRGIRVEDTFFSNEDRYHLFLLLQKDIEIKNRAYPQQNYIQVLFQDAPFFLMLSLRS